jgi:hypothetical protein
VEGEVEEVVGLEESLILGEFGAVTVIDWSLILEGWGFWMLEVY